MMWQRLLKLGARRRGNPSNLLTGTREIGKRLPGNVAFSEIVGEAKNPVTAYGPDGTFGKLRCHAMGIVSK